MVTLTSGLINTTLNQDGPDNNNTSTRSEAADVSNTCQIYNKSLCVVASLGGKYSVCLDTLTETLTETSFLNILKWLTPSDCPSKLLSTSSSHVWSVKHVVQLQTPYSWPPPPPPPPPPPLTLSPSRLRFTHRWAWTAAADPICVYPCGSERRCTWAVRCGVPSSSGSAAAGHFLRLTSSCNHTPVFGVVSCCCSEEICTSPRPPCCPPDPSSSLSALNWNCLNVSTRLPAAPRTPAGSVSPLRVNAEQILS